MEDKNRLHALDGLKLLFMFLIVMHHSGYFSENLHHAYMAVDLFFVISGFLLMRTLISKPKMDTGTYFRSRIRKLYPHYLLSFTAMYIAVSVYKGEPFNLNTILHSLPELLMIQNLGIFEGGVNYPCWYLSVLVYASVLLFFLGRLLPRRWFNTIAVLCSCFTYGYILYFTGGKMETFATVGVFYLPFWRGMAGLFCGTLLYQLHGSLQPVFRRHIKQFQALELTMLGVSVVMMFCSRKADGLILVSSFILLLAVGSEGSVWEHWMESPFVSAAIRYEYAVFLNHAFIIGLVKKLVPAHFSLPPMVKLAVLLVVLIPYSIITEIFVSKAADTVSRLKMRLKI